ncbi:phosphoribosylformylglycinamidine synthase subunit PurS [Candidatus Aciduliprofundum boonei]|uniref:Phosphoribosylformylglycinamidine synthase subunit PurS n=1 Tax=Aciduliprofundum boonei (strain DSM 19572 / T469) TaxID=439481 RepID=B5IGZ7_ACIB4|nr:phosphoribosylformylglycinamidine synthase subunit PurS [Candidatus Aciduliprofundum boonei]ADD08722.1 phosphoribosylformylglycinamidine synthase, purS [Aciduliprofundum boonei T469]EDY34459.1 phosphoribosylformylglycinamidine synthase, purS protein [Aciduliprofundum boonei T469]HII54905.1 phosphoribosylformylglycinamidine synthase subunit PurS [Candidatus Aciduliprofundum boonei]
MLKATIIVKLKEGVDDPEGKTIKHSLELLNFEGIKEVKVAKLYEIYLDLSLEDGKKEVEEMIKKLLVNPIIHDYEFRVEEI